MSNSVLVDIDGHVATVRLSRPEKRNAVSIAMLEELVAAARQLSDNAKVRAVVLAGDGDHFCAGIDTAVFTETRPEDLGRHMQPQGSGPANLFQNAGLSWRTLRVPVIAALQGSVFGAGLQIAMGADLRIAAPSTRCSVMEIRWGLIPDMGITATMRHLVRPDQLRELTYTGRIVDAEEAQRIGLLTRICPDPKADARQLAAEISTRSPDAVRAAKKLLNAGFDLNEREALRLEAELQLGIIGGSNQREAILANSEKRKPDFTDD